MKKILIVDDEISIIQTLDFFLYKEFVLKCTGSAEEALSVVLDFKPDLIITDLKLPNKDGLMLTKEIRKINQFKTIPIILISAFGIGENYVETHQVNAYLSKPFSLEELKENIISLLA